MFGALALPILVFAGGLFLLFGGPLWLSARAGVFSRGRQAPRWLEVVTSLGSRLGGISVLVYWLWAVTRGDALRFSLLAVPIMLGLFLLINGPLWLVVRSKAFSRGRQAPPWMEVAAIWFNRIIGGGVVLAGLVLSLRYWSLG